MEKNNSTAKLWRILSLMSSYFDYEHRPRQSHQSSAELKTGRII